MVFIEMNGFEIIKNESFKVVSKKSIEFFSDSTFSDSFYFSNNY